MEHRGIWPGVEITLNLPLARSFRTDAHYERRAVLSLRRSWESYEVFAEMSVGGGTPAFYVGGRGFVCR
jgi:hypothetical protein